MRTQDSENTKQKHNTLDWAFLDLSLASSMALLKPSTSTSKPLSSAINCRKSPKYDAYTKYLAQQNIDELRVPESNLTGNHMYPTRWKHPTARTVTELNTITDKLLTQFPKGNKYFSYANIILMTTQNICYFSLRYVVRFMKPCLDSCALSNFNIYVICI